jgi:hypothetical protein
MKSVLISALILASALAEKISTHTTEAEQNYISSISAFRKGYKVSDNNN